MKTKTQLNLIVTGLILFVFSLNNSLAQGGGEYHPFTLDVDGASREYLLYVPEGHNGNTAWPLVFNFHGFGGSNYSQINISRMHLVADTAHFLVVYPQGEVVQDLIFGGSAPGWYIPGVYLGSHDDIQFTNEIIDDLIANPDFAIDTNRIHATGFSNGGEMAYYTACALSERVASVGGVSAQMALIMMDSICTPDRQVSFLHMLGTEDPFYPVNGDNHFPPLEGAAEYWAANNNCDTIPTEYELPDIDPNDGSTVTLLTYDDCDDDFEVLCYRIEGGSHCWPDGLAIPCNNDINASAEIWEFFRRNPHPNIIQCYTNGITFSTQSMIDNFQNNYPYCLEIGGDVAISGNDITNLDGLSTLKVIDGDLQIHDNTSLMDLTGLNNLESINGDLIVYTNNILEDFSGLDNLKSIDGDLKIFDNNSLTSLTGLDRIAPGSINKLTIAVNNSLSYCAIISVCEYLGDPNGTTTIQDNAPGCNSQQELYEICWTNVNETQYISAVSIHPNPFNQTITIEYELSQHTTIQITIYNHLGKQLKVIQQNQSSGKQQVVWNAEGLPSGVYFCVIKTKSGTRTMKMIKMK